MIESYVEKRAIEKLYFVVVIRDSANAKLEKLPFQITFIFLFFFNIILDRDFNRVNGIFSLLF